MYVDPSESTPCAACGDPFVCGAGRLRALGDRRGEHPGASPGPSCWCRAVRLSDEARARAARTYHGCLCPACLRLLAGNRPGGRGVAGEDEGVAHPAPPSCSPDAVAESTWS